MTPATTATTAGAAGRELARDDHEPASGRAPGLGGDAGRTGAESARSGGARAGAWGLSLAVLVVGTFMSVLDTSVVNVAMTVLRKEFGVGADDIQWVSTVYNLTEGVVVPTGAWLGTRFGLKRVYVVTLLLFTGASALCGASTSLPMLIVCRILQAIPGGIMPVACQTILYRVVPKEKLGVAMGMYGLGVVVAPATGPTIGGFLIDNFGWRCIFLVNIPVGLLGALAAGVILQRQPSESTRRFDLPGFLCVGTALFALLLAFEKGTDWGWGGYRILILLMGAVDLLALFVVVEFHVEHPLLDLRMLRHKQFVLAIVLISSLFIALMCVMFYAPLYLQGVRGLSALDAGSLMLPQGLAMAMLMPVSGMLCDRYGSRWLAVVGLSLTGTGVLLLSDITVDTSYSTVKWALVVMGAGMGLAMMPIMTGGLSALPSELTDSGSALNTLAQRVSGAFGLAVLTAIVTSNQAQFWVDRASLMPTQGADIDPRIAQMQRMGPSGLVALWQQLADEVQTQSYRNGFVVAAAVAFFGAALALLARSGPAAEGSEPTVVH